MSPPVHHVSFSKRVSVAYRNFFDQTVAYTQTEYLVVDCDLEQNGRAAADIESIQVGLRKATTL